MPKVIFKVETSHHEGYCTDNECEYDCWEEEHEVEDLENLEPLAAIIKDGEEHVMDKDNPSHWCLQDDKSTKKGIGRHGCTVTVVDVVPQTKAAR